MVNVLPSAPGTITSGSTFVTQKNKFLTRCSVFRRSRLQALPAQKYILPLSTSVRLFPQFSIRHGLQSRLNNCSVLATGADVAVEEAGSPATENGSEAVETPSDAVDKSEEPSVKSDASAAPARTKALRIAKSVVPPVKNEELVPGATFTGKVKSIQPFGAFVDFGAFTDGLVHVSKISDSYVKDVNSFLSVGQEVTVRLLEVNMETGRISLTMREGDDSSKPQQPQQGAPFSNEKPRTPRKSNQRPNQRNEIKKSSNLVKGQDLVGTVKKLTRSGAFLSLPEGEEGFLPHSEEAGEAFADIMGGSSLEVGEEVNVRVLRIKKGQVTLTMKKEEDAAQLDSALNQGVVHTATNPFALAFRSNKDISAFLDNRMKEEKAAAEVEEDKNKIAAVVEKEEDTSAEDENKVAAVVETEEDTSAEATVKDQGLEGTISDTSETVDEAQSVEEAVVEAESREQIAEVEEDAPVSSVENTASEVTVEEGAEGTILDTSQSADDRAESVEEETVDIGSKEQSVEVTSEAEQIPEEAPTVEAVETVADSNSPNSMTEEIPEKQSDDVMANVGTETQTPVEEKEIPSPIPDEQVAADSAVSTSGEIDVPPTPESPIADIGRDAIKVDIANVGTETQTPVEEKEIPSPIPDEQVATDSPVSTSGEIDAPPTPESPIAEGPSGGEIIADEVKSTVVNGSEQIQTPPPEEKTLSAATVKAAQNGTPEPNGTTVKGAISSALVKQLRNETGAGMMDCKRALSETGGDIIKAQEFLRKKGLASAEKKSSRATAEGRIGSYIHDSRIGVLIEVNCETDFVSRGEIFKELVDDLAMQVAACPQVQYLVPEDVPQEMIDKEREIEMQKEDLLSKPEQIRSKIVDGRIRKRLEELALLEQPYIKNDKVVIRDWVKQTIATIGENIKVKRFVRYNLGEGLEKKSQDFAAEVAAQTASKPTATPAGEQPPAAENKEDVKMDSKPAVSAALVKQLREETGAGMMDCKKALSETGGDIDKAQEYLRKKGLSTADKKSSRLAAEGRIGSYIHDSRIGVLIEVNCETDFVGRSEKFKELVNDLAMQVVASPQVQYVFVEDIPESIRNKEKELEMQREDLQSKPENIREKIVEGRVSKRLGELALVEQPFLKDDSILVKDLVKQTVAALGENIKVRRFIRFTLGESSDDTETESQAEQE